MKLKNLAILILPTHLLLGCNSSSEVDLTKQTSIPNCSITLTQDGVEIKSKVEGNISHYEMKAAPFRLEAPSEQCNPSLATFPTDEDFQYVANNQFVLSDSGLGLAEEYTDKDVIITHSENPRFVGESAGDDKDMQKDYEAICKDLKTCPLKARAVRNYWNFVSDAEGSPSTHAELKRYSLDKKTINPNDVISLIVYTKVKDTLDQHGNSNYNLLETHPMVLHFK